MTIVKPSTAIVPDDAAEGPAVSLPLPDGRTVVFRRVSGTDGLRSLRLPWGPDGRRQPLLQLTVDAGLDVAEVDRLLHVHDDDIAVLGAVGSHLVAVGRLAPSPGERDVELEILVAPSYRGLAVERVVFGCLAARAHRSGIAIPDGGVP